MQAEKLAKYLTELKNKTGLSYEAIGEMSDRPESTVKNLCAGKVEDPRLDTVAPIVYALGGSVDEMLNPGKSKDEIKEVSVSSLKEMYEFQISSMKETNEAHISNIRNHYEQHHEDLKENFEKRLADKREIIELLTSENNKLKEQLKKQEHDTKIGNVIRNCIIGLFVCGTITLLILEFIYLEKGWITI